MDKFKIKLAKLNGTAARLYPKLVAELISRKYEPEDELALLRQKDDKPEEFAAYYSYAEACKREARDILGLASGRDLV